ncbi:spore maturation protein CgeB [Melghirimyces profundicolus]|uniref:Spore maturation protein CgeB n=1 Tax=Melghirimyces profundicolus TaxID=1242148 RepID=A0A2T6B234_9BACL|nr:glycosyltransferase [Melghirimyces profundicolus]PTX50131.1 spore maturation protein CgeB [Melghirimyces profundicolus]
MRVLFFDSNKVLVQLLPVGFLEAGHVVRIAEPSRQNILSHIRTFNPDLIFTQGWSMTTSNLHTRLLIHKYAKSFRIPLVYWSVEDPLFTNQYVFPIIKTLKPDFVFTICPSCVDNYKKHGYSSSFLDFGYKPTRHSSQMNKEYECDIALVANSYYPNGTRFFQYRFKTLRNLLLPLLEHHIPVNFWGNGWQAFITDHLHQKIPKTCNFHGVIPYTEVEKVYQSAKIILCPQNLPDQLTLRTYDILGSGGFLLTVDTPAVRRMFRPNHDLLASSSPNETVKLVKHYLKDSAERNRIREQGRISVANHSYKHRVKEVIKVLKQNRII